MESERSTVPVDSGESSDVAKVGWKHYDGRNKWSSGRMITTIVAVIGFIFFLLSSGVFLSFRYYDTSALLIIIFFIASLISSWSAVALMKSGRDAGTFVEILSWAIAMLDSIILITVILIAALGQSYYGGEF